MSKAFASILGIVGVFATYVGLTTIIKRHASGKGGSRGLAHPDLYGNEAVQYGFKWFVPGIAMIFVAILWICWCVKNDID